jgi:hypothetical protein
VSFAYRVYGLSCLSDTRISGFWRDPEIANQPDVAFSLGLEPPTWVRTARGLPLCILRHGSADVENPTCTVIAFGAGEFFEFVYSDGIQFVTDREARRVWGGYSLPLTIDDLAVYLRGPLMGFVLRRRGVTALHASAADFDGRAVVLCGPSEAGKSTTAAALALRGVPVLSDDITALVEVGGCFQVEPGYPRLCLWPAAVRELYGAPGALPRLTSTWEKCYLPLDGGHAKFEPHRRPLGAIYLLASRVAKDNARIEELSTRDALLQLVQNTYMNWILDRDQRAAEFEVLSKLVTQVPVRRIVPHSDPARIRALCDLIVNDCGDLIGRQQPTSRHPSR